MLELRGSDTLQPGRTAEDPVNVDLDKIARDLRGEEKDIRLLALTTAVQLTSLEGALPEQVESLLSALDDATEIQDPDTVFLARKGLNHVRNLQRSGERPQGFGLEIDRQTALEQLREEGDPVAFSMALAALAKASPTREDAPVILPYLESQDDRVRANAVEVVEAIGDAELVATHLTPLIEDPNHRVRANVGKALGKLGHPQVLEVLGKMIRSGNLAEREASVYALSFLKGDPVLELLHQALQDPYEGIRLRATKALGRLKDPRSLGPLKALLNDIDIDVCEEADRAIRFIGMEASQPVRHGIAGTALGRAAGLGGAPSPAPKSEAPAPEPESAPTEAVAEFRALVRRRREALLALGQKVFALIKGQALSHPNLEPPFYEVLKGQEFLLKMQSRFRENQLSDVDEDETRTGIQGKIQDALVALGDQALSLEAASNLDLTPAGEFRDRVVALDQEIEAKT